MFMTSGKKHLSQNLAPAMLIYDGACPFCNAFVHLYRIQDAVGGLSLINARDDSAMKQDMTQLGWNLDRGMVLRLGNNLYFGEDALHMLALVGTRSNLFNRFNALLFKSRWMAKCFYPLFRFGRQLALWVKGIPAINNLDKKS